MAGAHTLNPRTGRRDPQRLPGWTLALAVLLAAGPAFAQQQGPSRSGTPALTPSPAPALPIDAYIRNAWQTLRRSMNECASLVDPKIRTRPVLYLPLDYPEPPQVAALDQKCGVHVERLPVRIEHPGQNVRLPVPGLLYLPNAYVVPGGRFNEMYGWDSYFILLGLLQDGRTELARGMVENFFFEIEHYGGILNANRTYYLTRSQPPFLSSMIRAIWEADVAAGHRSEAVGWLERAYGFAQRDHALWTSGAHRAGNTGLARYYDFGEGPIPEMGDDPRYYQNVIVWLLKHPEVHTSYLVEGPRNPTAADRAKLTAISCDPGMPTSCARDHIGTHWLSREYYKGDRAMRESGFDPSFRFGPFSGSTQDYAPMCLNSLLYRYERDLAWMATQLSKPDEAQQWNAAADRRRAAIDRYLWNPAKGMYFDYNFTAGKQSTYNYLPTYYPLWAGAANAEQARRVEANLKLFNKPGGLAMSTFDSGVQWDLPYGWAPVIWIAVDGMARCGDVNDAELVSREFTATVQKNYSRDRTIREKFNVVTASSVFQVTAGYSQNVVGFGWTNAVYLKMQSLLQHAGAQASAGAAGAASGTGGGTR